MPIYEYSCPKCGEFEVTQRITEEPLKKCPTCKSKVRKLISNTSFQLKGSGWYATDYAGKKATKEGGKDEGKAASGEGSATESKSSDTAAKDSNAKESSKPAKKDTSAKAA